MSDLPPSVQALLKPEAYPELPAQIELMQTQMSFIFLTGNFAYKIKKPVNLGYLDYSTLDKRLFFCNQELKLNRRLCPDVYLDVLPVTESTNGFHIGGSGKIIDYAVKMKQLPRDRMMDVLLPRDAVTVPMIEEVAARMADFHKRAATSTEIGAYGSVAMIKTSTDENFSQTEKYIGAIISSRSWDFIRRYTNGFLEERSELFKQRVADGRIKDCHGDLHAAHVCFAGDIYIYDCIEFNDRFRYCDVASEIAFLAMDLERFGKAGLAKAFVNAYTAQSRDDQVDELLNFYKCYRAYVRGKVACFKYDDPYLKNKDAIAAEAQLYFGLAHLYADTRPVLIIVTGLMGTGKTTVAKQAGGCLGYEVLSSDVIRKKLAQVPLTEHRYEDFKGGIYSDEFTARTYAELFRQARGLLQAGHPVILDASFKKRAGRLEAQKLARELGAAFLVIECVADDDIVKRRLDKRAAESSVSDGRREIFEDQKKDFDKVNEFPQDNHLVLDTASPSGNIMPLLLRRVTGL